MHRLSPSFSRALHIDVPITRAGTFGYYLTYAPLPPFSSSSNAVSTPSIKTEVRYFTVSPCLAINDNPLPLDSLAIFSVISKWLGPAENWDIHMKYIAEKGYNMVHFTPMMHRGASNSPYSIYDQLAFDPEAFPNGTKDVVAIVEKMEKEHKLLSLTDVVWNHTAHNSLWLQSHPEAGYNLVTAPWLEAAYELDTALLDFGNKLDSLGYPADIETKEDLLKVMDGVKTHVVGALRLWEYYVLDVKSNTAAAVKIWLSGKSNAAKLSEEYKKDLSLYDKAQLLSTHGLVGADRQGERFRRKIDPEIGAAFLELEFGKPKKPDAEKIEEVTSEYTKALDELNLPFYKEYDVDSSEILEQLYNRITYLRVDENGPKMGKVSKENPLIETYFTRLPHNKTTAKHDPKSLALANNGWIWSNVSDFAGPHSRSYLRREVIVWGDCVKLRFGDKPEDSPFLWQFMVDYTKLMARCFHGFRIDNCHSTPLHVGQYLLDVARLERNDLYIVAELFTGSETKDREFVERLGLGSLVREAMVAWGPGELSRLVHRHGGKPIGSFEQDFIVRGSQKTIGANGSASGKASGNDREVIKAVTASPIHALFMDCTHDNETPAQKRTPHDTLPNGALVGMCDCGIGSVMGYDEVYPKLLNLVTEPRVYYPPPAKLDESTPGIGGVTALFNRIHEEMGRDGFTEMHVHHEGEYITVHRVHPKSHRGYFLIAHTAFSSGDHRGDINPIVVTGPKFEPIGSWKLEVDDTEEAKVGVLEDPKYLTGLPAKTVKLENPLIEVNGSTTTITVPKKFPPGSVALLKTWITGMEGEALDNFITSCAETAFADTNLADLNFILYRAESEEKDSSENQDGCYNIPGFGPLVYAGLQGWWSVLRDIIRNNDLAHPLCQHLREGQWALDYVVGRMEKLEKRGHKGLAGPTKWLKERFDKVREVPAFLLPRYFGLVIQTAYTTAVERAAALFTDDIREGTAFLKGLSLVSLQMTGFVITLKSKH